jgi:outer membrane biosynthesis protein TonB
VLVLMLAVSGVIRIGFTAHADGSVSKVSILQSVAEPAKLNRKVPIIVRECRNYPASRFARFLPQEIRKILKSSCGLDDINRSPDRS